MKNSIVITEPYRGEQAMIALNDWVTKHYILTQLIPFTADVFVFTYPVYLVALYLYGIGKKQNYYKEAALYIFFASGLASVINMTIQFFGDKSRPELAIDAKHQLILHHLPTDPFPSDHAAVSAAVAMASLLRGMRHQDKLFMRLSIFFWIACGLMSFSRVAVAIHWPTDIMVGIIVGVFAATVLLSKSVWSWLKNKILPRIFNIEKIVFEDRLRIK